MAFNFGALLTGANRGLAGYRQGQMAGEDQRAQQDASEKAALFAEYAKRRQMDQEDASLRQREAAAQALAANREEVTDLRRRVDEFGSWRDRATAGQGGTVDRTNDSQERRTGATNTSRESQNTADNQTRMAAALLRAATAGATQRAPRTQAVQDKDGNWTVIPLDTPGPTGVQGRVPGAATQRISQRDMDEMQDLQSHARQAEEALRVTRGAKNWAGPVDSFMRGLKNKMQRPDTQANEAAAAYSRVTTPILTGQFGAALTKLEEARIAPYIPDLESSNEQVASAALEHIARELRTIMKERVDARKAGGFDTTEMEALIQKWGQEGGGDADAAAKAKLEQFRSRRP